MKDLVKRTYFVRKLLSSYGIGSKNAFLDYLTTLLTTTERSVRNTEKLATASLAKRLEKPKRLLNGRGAILGLKMLLGDIPETVYFPSRYYATYIENTLGARIEFDFFPELIMPFSYSDTVDVKYNPTEYVIETNNVYKEIVELYRMRPKAVFIVSKFIEWKGFYKFVNALKPIEKLPKTFIITSDPILPEIAEKYNLVRIPSKSHAKILMLVWDKVRYCFIGSMNVLSPSNHDDFLIMHPNLEKYCVEFLLRAIV